MDICTSYTFYYFHPIEWVAVCEERASWEGRRSIIDWHISYTPEFREVSRSFGLAEALDQDYQSLSSYVHGIPIAGLPTLRGIERSRISDESLDKFISVANRVDRNLNLLYLSVAHQHMATLSQADFRTIMRGIDRGRLAEAGVVVSRT